jgi:Zn finger protein HypA/HybF involved in hydrogenase expression
MSDPYRQFWTDVVAEAADACGAALTSEQLDHVAAAVQSAHDCYGMAFYQPPSPEPSQIERLEAELLKERSKVVCPTCRGEGYYVSHGPAFVVRGTCHRCNGEGKVLPA